MADYSNLNIYSIHSTYICKWTISTIGIVPVASRFAQLPHYPILISTSTNDSSVVTSRVPIRKKEFGSRYDEIMMKQWSRKQSRVAGATDTSCGCGFDY